MWQRRAFLEMRRVEEVNFLMCSSQQFNTRFKGGIGRLDERAFSQSMAALASSNARVAGRGFSPATAVVAVHEPLLG